MRTLIFLACLFPIAATINSCSEAAGSEPETAIPLDNNKAFSDYWYANNAELTSYQLQQARYGETHTGEAVLVFVTEPFSRSKQVKLDGAGEAGDKVDVLKLNFTKKFNTGLYPYSMMASVFSPVNYSKDKSALKVSCSSQEWCGHTYTQLNLKKNKYNVEGHSYFESEGDEEFQLNRVLLEDEVWNRIRLNPDGLPTGTIKIIPGTFSSRLRHKPLAVESAKAKLQDTPGQRLLREYEIEFLDSERSLKIYFKKNFPYEIQAWEETYVSGWGDSAKTLTTKAVKKKQLRVDYWNKHSVADSKLREELGLD